MLQPMRAFCPRRLNIDLTNKRVLMTSFRRAKLIMLGNHSSHRELFARLLKDRFTVVGFAQAEL